MKIAVVAANGRSGHIFVERALTSGHTVRAGVYGRHRFETQKALQTVECNAINLKEVETLVTGVDAVVSLIGQSKNSPENVQTKAMSNIILAMKKHNITRLVSVTGTGVRLKRDRIRLIDRILNAGLSLLDPARMKDGISHFELMKDSGLEWTLLRVLKLQNTTPRGVRLTLYGPARIIVSRYDVADAILQVLEKKRFIRQAPIIS